MDKFVVFSLRYGEKCNNFPEWLLAIELLLSWHFAAGFFSRAGVGTQQYSEGR